MLHEKLLTDGLALLFKYGVWTNRSSIRWEFGKHLESKRWSETESIFLMSSLGDCFAVKVCEDIGLETHGIHMV